MRVWNPTIAAAAESTLARVLAAVHVYGFD
jgi:hypothetical protein